MKYYLRLFLSVFLLVSLFSCMSAKGGKKYATLDDPLASSRRKGTYRIKLEKSENLNEAESSRRKGANLQVREKEAQEGAGSTSSSINQSTDKSNSLPEKTITGDNNTNKEEKNRSVFKPFIPEDKPSATTEVPPGKMPDEVKEQIINLEETSGEEYITLNFEQAPLEDIINTVSETLSLNYIVSSGIKGQITMQTKQK